jgi:hypothetical protein
VIEQSTVTGHTLGNLSCIFEQDFTDNMLSYRICNYVIRRESIPPAFVKLSLDTYVLLNIASTHVECTRQVAIPVSSHACNPCSLTGMWVRIATSTFSLIKAPECSSDNQTSSTSMLHAVNLPLLKSLYKLTIHIITSHDLFNLSCVRQLSDIHPPLFGEEVSSLLAAGKSIGYLLNKMEDNLKNESVLLHSSAEAMLLSILDVQ